MPETEAQTDRACMVASSSVAPLNSVHDGVFPLNIKISAEILRELVNLSSLSTMLQELFSPKLPFL